MTSPLDPATRARLRESCIEVVTRGMGRVDPVAVIDVLDALDDREAKLAKAEQERDAWKASSASWEASAKSIASVMAQIGCKAVASFIAGPTPLTFSLEDVPTPATATSEEAPSSTKEPR